MKRIPRHRHTCLLSKQATPVARVAPGESVVFETWDALGGRVRSHKDALELSLPREMGNPATGPVYVEGARTGDTLGVEIIDIRLGDLGYGRVKSGGVIIDELKPPAANLTPIRNGMVRFNETLSFPVRPMVGVVGVAPRGDPVPTFYPGDHGGNMDVNAAITGSTVFLPVSTPGGLLAIGDVHARMGDGELNGGGLDIAADVMVQVTLHKGLGWKRPVIEMPDAWCTCANAPTLEKAIRQATHDMVRMLSKGLEMSLEEAFILVGAAGDARIGQAASLGMDCTAYLSIPKQILQSAKALG